jgi:hypothetical protein
VASEFPRITRHAATGLPDAGMWPLYSDEAQWAIKMDERWLVLMVRNGDDNLKLCKFCAKVLCGSGSCSLVRQSLLYGILSMCLLRRRLRFTYFRLPGHLIVGNRRFASRIIVGDLRPFCHLRVAQQRGPDLEKSPQYQA